MIVRNLFQRGRFKTKNDVPSVSDINSVGYIIIECDIKYSKFYTMKTMCLCYLSEKSIFEQSKNRRNF